LYSPFVEEVADAAEVAEPFLADVADEEDVAAGLDLARVHRIYQRQQGGEPGAVVADARGHQLRALAADGDVRPFGKDGVEVRRDDHDRPGLGPLAQREHVAFLVDLRVEPALAEHLGEGLRARLLLERRRGDLGDRDDVLDPLVVIGIEGSDRGAVGWTGDDLADGRVRVRSR